MTVPSTLVKKIGDMLPESSNAGSAFTSSAFDPNIHLQEDAEVKVTFLHEGAGYRNTLGYFTYTVGGGGAITIVDRQLIFPNASLSGSGGVLRRGDASVLRDTNGSPRTFSAGTRIGFFVIAAGWSSSTVQNWNAGTATVPSTSPSSNTSPAQGTYTTIDSLNRENALGRASVARHVAMILVRDNDFRGGDDVLLVGFEDLNRASGADNDFNDVVFFVSATPATAIADQDVPDFTEITPNDDTDSDGVKNISDTYPSDPTRAFVTRYPTSGSYTVALEDNYPSVGDADYNDAVVAYEFQLVTSASGSIKDLIGTFHLAARGAGRDARMGVHFPGMPSNATGDVLIERFLSDSEETHEVGGGVDLTVEEVIAASNRLVVFESTRDALPALSEETFTNTESDAVGRSAASARFRIIFDTAVSPAVLGTVPYDLYFEIDHSAGYYDIHFPGKPGFSDRLVDLPTESGESSFLDDNGYPWLVEVPANWRWPLETVHVATSYTAFAQWRTSRGTKSKNWYDAPSGSVGAALSSYLVSRDWTVDLPAP